MTVEGEQGCPETDPETMVQEQIVYQEVQGTREGVGKCSREGRQITMDAAMPAASGG